MDPLSARLARAVARRTAGGGRAILQRAQLDGRAIAKLDSDDRVLQKLLRDIAEHNRADKADDAYACLAALRSIERRIYGWMDVQAAGPGLLDSHRGVPELRALLADVEREHAARVDALKDGKVPPIGTSEHGELASKVWRGIVDGSGKIKLVGGPGFNRRVLAELAKLLDTPTGLRLLAFLSTPVSRPEKPDSLDALLTNIYIGEHTAQLPAAVRKASPLLQDRGNAEAQPLGIDDQRTRDVTINVKTSPLREEEDEADYPTIESAKDVHKVRDAAWAGRRGFVSGDTKYTFGPGTGAFVTAPLHHALNAGRDDREILTPAWVTLGHELGHAANMRAGASMIEQSTLTACALMEKLTVGPDRGADRWDNLEEMFNIENVENAIRKEARLSERDSHRAPMFTNAIAAQIRNRVMRPVNALYAKCSQAEQRVIGGLPDTTALLRVNRVPGSELLNPAVRDEWLRMADDFLRRWTEGDADDPRPNAELRAMFVEAAKAREDRRRAAAEAKSSKPVTTKTEKKDEQKTPKKKTTTEKKKTPKKAVAAGNKTNATSGKKKKRFLFL